MLCPKSNRTYSITKQIIANIRILRYDPCELTYWRKDNITVDSKIFLKSYFYCLFKNYKSLVKNCPKNMRKSNHFVPKLYLRRDLRQNTL